MNDRQIVRLSNFDEKRCAAEPSVGRATGGIDCCNIPSAGRTAAALQLTDGGRGVKSTGRGLPARH